MLSSHMAMLAGLSEMIANDKTNNENCCISSIYILILLNTLRAGTFEMHFETELGKFLLSSLAKAGIHLINPDIPGFPHTREGIVAWMRKKEATLLKQLLGSY
jgi:hypothetical protein